MDSSAKKHVRARLFKRLGTIGLLVSAIFITVVLIVAILPKGNEAFTIRVDDLDTSSHFRISATRSNGSEEDGESETYLVGKSISDIHATSASKIINYLDYELDYDEVTGKNQNYYHYSENQFTGEKTADYGYAIVYTVYLTNVTKEEQQVKYQLVLEDYVEPSTPDSAKLIDYVRFVVRTEDLTKNESPEYLFFANQLSGKSLNHDIITETKGSDGNYREPVSSFSYDFISDPDHDILKSNFGSDGNNETPTVKDKEGNDVVDPEYDWNNRYCLNFNPIANGNKYIVTPDIAPELILAPNQELRFTMAIYFEGNDVDLVGSAPSDASMRFSLHFGY